MSLLSIRSERKDLAGINPARPPRLWKLGLMLAVVLYLIWYLGRLS
jgi:hypothetical protein